jgi:hypothetical protein
VRLARRLSRSALHGGLRLGAWRSPITVAVSERRSSLRASAAQAASSRSPIRARTSSSTTARSPTSPGRARCSRRTGTGRCAASSSCASTSTATRRRPAGPVGVDVRTYRDEDEEELYCAHRDAFADHWGEGVETREDLRHEVAGSPLRSRALVPRPCRRRARGLRRDRGGGAGGSGARVRRAARVRPRFRRHGRGAGGGLRRQAFQALAARDKRGCDLHVDAESLTGATRLYERVGMRSHPRFATWEKELRPGS